MSELTKALHEYYNISGASILEDSEYYIVQFKASAELFSDTRKKADIQRKIKAYTQKLDLEKLGEITKEEEMHGLQKVLFWALNNSYHEGYFNKFPEDADVNLAPYSGMYTAPVNRLRDLILYAGKTMYSRIKVFAGSKPRPDFRADIDKGNLSLNFRKDMGFKEIEMYSFPFVGSEDVAFWVARAVDIFKNEKN